MGPAQAWRRKFHSPQVLPLWEAFLLQMDDFDRYLEHELRHLLDPVVALRPPARRGRLNRADRPAPPALLMVEPVVVTLPVTSGRSL